MRLWELWILRRIAKELRILHEKTEAIHVKTRSHNASTEDNPVQVGPINASVTTEFGVAANKYYEAENRERETLLGKHRAKFEATGVVVAIVRLFLNLAVLCQVKRQADAAQKQVGVMRKQLEATDRPWVTAKVQISSALTSNENGLRITFLFTGQNIGKSPAQFVGVDPELVPSIGPPIQRQREICDIQTSRYTHASSFGGPLLFPGQLSPDFSESHELLLTWKNLDDYWRQFTSKDGKVSPGPTLLPLDVTGCFGYASPSKMHHQTAFSYRISLIDGRNPFRKDLPIPPAQLRLIPDFAGFWGN
jgi:hypothetical protein